MARALLVEDDWLRGRAMERDLRAKGFEVTWAGDATRAVEALLASATPFDLATLDNDLGPGPTGEEVARHIARLPAEFRPARVEVHTNNDAAADRMVALLRKAGVNVHRKELTP